MKENKVRTSITINPTTLHRARIAVAEKSTPFKSVAALIQAALDDKLNQLAIEQGPDLNPAEDANGHV